MKPMKQKSLRASAALAALVVAACQTAPTAPSPSSSVIAARAVVQQLRRPGDVAEERAALMARLRRENEERLRLNALSEDVIRLLDSDLVAGEPFLAELRVGESRVAVPPGRIEAVLVFPSRGYPESAVIIAPVEGYTRGEYRPSGTIRPYLFEVQGSEVVATCSDLCPSDVVVILPLYRR